MLVDILLKEYPRSSFLKCAEKRLREIERIHSSEIEDLIKKYGDTPEAIAAHFFYIIGKYRIKMPVKCRIKLKFKLSPDDYKLISDVARFAFEVRDRQLS